MRGDGLRVRQGRLRLEIGNNFCPGRAVRCWPRLPRAGGESPSLGGFKHRGDVALRDVVEQVWGVGVTAGLGDLGGLFQP